MSSRLRIVLLVVVLSIVGAVSLRLWIGIANESLVVTILDVGQGDAILIQTPGGNDILIDGGPDRRVVTRLEEILAPANRTLELVIVTHPDLDHIGGLSALADFFSIDRVLETGLTADSRVWREWQEDIERQGSARLVARAGQAFMIDEIRLEVLWPRDEMDLKTTKRNNTSIVIKLTFGLNELLFTGDIDAEIEQVLIDRGLDIDVDVLKVPHHGSISSSSVDFIHATSPDAAIISSGKFNRFGHPHPVVLRRYEMLGGRVLRTDELGDVMCRSNGKLVTCD